MTERILCLGDSNTYGYDPRDPLGRRYPPEARWPEILAGLSGREVVNLGQNGMRIPVGAAAEDVLRPLRAQMPAALLVILLGSNDVLSPAMPGAEEIAARMDAFLRLLREAFPAQEILLLSPPRSEVPLAHIQEVFRALPARWEALSRKHGLRYADAFSWPLPLAADWVHFSPEAHREFARRLLPLLDAE